MGNIMVIDDSLVDRKMIRRVVERKLHDVIVYEAEDGFDLRDKLLNYNIHLCILDIMMPGKDGFQVLNDLKEDERLIDIPVIVCTGTDDKQAIEKALELGAYDYFSKPLSEEAMKISLPLKVKNAIELFKRKQDIEFLSYHDKLTGLYNRRYWEEEIKKLDVEVNWPFSLIVGDVNGLKLTNDAFGHEAGDKLLVKIAGIMKKACEHGELVSRIGGDEFLIALPKTDLSEADRLVSRIRAICMQEKEEPIKPSLSFGVSVKEDRMQDIMEVFRTAEDRMYTVKLMESKSIRSSIITSLRKTLGERSRAIEEHSNRLVELSKILGRELGLSPDQIQNLKLVALLHDIGITGVPERIVNKKGGLLQEEWEIVKSHCEIGYRIASSSAEVSHVASDILSHHEHWNGEGYPQGLSKDMIPLNARIISVIDTYDSMLNGCCYHEPAEKKNVIEYIKNQAHKQFDPQIVDVFCNKVCGELDEE